jgi:hypothetical protein
MYLKNCITIADVIELQLQQQQTTDVTCFVEPTELTFDVSNFAGTYSYTFDAIPQLKVKAN